MRKLFLAITPIFILQFSLFGQPSGLYINEFVADNSSGLQDEDYEFPDWIELYNDSSTPIDLTGYSLTDDPLENTKWIFPSLSLPSNHYLVVFASGKDLYHPPVIWSTIIEAGDEWKYTVPNSSTPTNWYFTDFDDSGWDTGKSSIGYGDDDDSTVVADGTLSVFMRTSFTVNDVNTVQRGMLHMDYDDAFVAYLNGTEIARANLGIPGTSVPFDTPADGSDHEAKMYSGGIPDAFEVTNIHEVLVTGSNVLSIQVHNAGTGSSDLTAIPFLSLGFTTYGDTPYTSPWLDLPASSLHTNFKLNRGGEFLGLYDAVGNVVDSLTFGSQKTDISFGRSSQDPSQWGFFDEATPGVENGTISFQFSGPPAFSLQGGFYTGPQEVSLSTVSTTAEIYYTLDGKVPNKNARLYAGSITLDSTTAIRAIVIEDGKIPSEVFTQTYFIDEEINLPFISLVTDPDHLFSDQSGIYVTGTNGTSGACDPTIRNLNRDWERPVNIEFFETTGQLGLNQVAGIKIFGGCSRTRYPQKSFALYARSEYGKGSFDYQFFPDKEIYEFESIILRSSADDQTRTMIKDAFAHYVQIEYMDIDYQAYRPGVVFINGVYWGIHNIREKINEHYLAENYGVDTEDVNILQNNGSATYGFGTDYHAMIDFISNNSMGVDNNYNYIQNQMDINQYIDYQIANIYLAEVDWPGNNIKFWNSNSQSHHKWRWITFDRDQTFLPYRIHTDALALATAPNDPGWPNPPWSTLLFRKLLTNETFKNTFIQLYAYHLNTTFEPQRISDLVDEFKIRIEYEIPRHIERWGGQVDPEMNESWTAPPTFSSVAEWENNINEIKYFASQRPAVAISNLENKFEINGMSMIDISKNNKYAGKIKLYHKELPYDGYSGEHFNEIPIQLSAIAIHGYRFSHWILSTTDGQETNEDPMIEIIPAGNISLTAFFEENTTPARPVVIINEINYNSQTEENPGDWVELFNTTSEFVDLSGWQLKDGNDENMFIFPEDIDLAPHAFLVVCENLDDFHAIHPNVNNRIGNMDFKFSNDGEVIRLYGPDETLIDSVLYDDQSPWPEAADGLGPTLELINPGLNNDLASSWVASLDLGTPGRRNHTITAIPDVAGAQSGNALLGQNYPNPVNDRTLISFTLSQPAKVQLTLHDIMGREVIAILNEYQVGDDHRIAVDATNLPEGIYIYSLQVDNTYIASRRLVVDHE